MKTAQVYQPRKINHPNFKNMSFYAAKDFLQDKPVGEFVFRPSSKVFSLCQGSNYLNLSWKFYDNIIQHIMIREDQKAQGMYMNNYNYIIN